MTTAFLERGRRLLYAITLLRQITRCDCHQDDDPHAITDCGSTRFRRSHLSSGHNLRTASRRKEG